MLLLFALEGTVNGILKVSIGRKADSGSSLISIPLHIPPSKARKRYCASGVGNSPVNKVKLKHEEGYNIVTHGLAAHEKTPVIGTQDSSR